MIFVFFVLKFLQTGVLILECALFLLMIKQFLRFLVSLLEAPIFFCWIDVIRWKLDSTYKYFCRHHKVYLRICYSITSWDKRKNIQSSVRFFSTCMGSDKRSLSLKNDCLTNGTSYILQPVMSCRYQKSVVTGICLCVSVQNWILLKSREVKLVTLLLKSFIEISDQNHTEENTCLQEFARYHRRLPWPFLQL